MGPYVCVVETLIALRASGGTPPVSSAMAI